jgi:predicted MFS family arabinose efflux permease
VNLTTSSAPVEHRSVLKVVLSAPRPVWILIVGTFINRVGSFFSTFATLFLTHHGVSASDLPLVLVGVGVTSMIGSLGGGWLSDRLGRRNALVLSMFASAAALLLLSFAVSLPLIVAAVCLVGLCVQAYLPAASALLVDYSRPEDRVPIFAFFRLALNVGAALGPLIAGVLAARSYTLLFEVDGLTSALCGIVIFVGIKRTDRAPSVSPAQSPADSTPAPDTGEGADAGEGAGAAASSAAVTPEPVKAPPSGVPVMALCVAFFGIAMIYAQYRSTVPLELLRHGFSTVFYGALLTLNGSLVIVGELPISSRTRRLPWQYVVIAGVLTMAIGLAVSGLAKQAVLVVAAFAVFTVGEMIFAPVANAAVAQLSPAGKTARYQGLLATAQTLGFALGPAAGTSILPLSAAGLWAGTLGLACLCCAAIYIIWRMWQ